jgi:hypothetical protein
VEFYEFTPSAKDEGEVSPMSQSKGSLQKCHFKGRDSKVQMATKAPSPAFLSTTIAGGGWHSLASVLLYPHHRIGIQDQ